MAAGHRRRAAVQAGHHRAAVLIVIGILLVGSRDLVERLGTWGERGQRFLPLGSAIIVTALGAGMCIKGLLEYFS